MVDKQTALRLTFLGTGTSQGIPIIGCHCRVCRSDDPRDRRLRTSALLSRAGINVVIDAGPDFRQQMLQHQVETLGAILLTHEHVDHIFGLDDIRAYNWLQKKATDIYAGNRVNDAVRRIFDYVFSEWKFPGVPKMLLHDVGEIPFVAGGMEFIPIHCFHHKLPVLGFRTGDLSYLTDVNFIPDGEIEKIRGSKVLVVNALRIEKHISHFNLEEALRLVEIVSPDRTYLTHISHNMGLYSEVESKLPENVHLAYDGLVTEI